MQVNIHFCVVKVNVSMQMPRPGGFEQSNLGRQLFAIGVTHTHLQFVRARSNHTHVLVHVG